MYLLAIFDGYRSYRNGDVSVDVDVSAIFDGYRSDRNGNVSVDVDVPASHI